MLAKSQHFLRLSSLPISPHFHLSFKTRSIPLFVPFHTGSGLSNCHGTSKSSVLYSEYQLNSNSPHLTVTKKNGYYESRNNGSYRFYVTKSKKKSKSSTRNIDRQKQLKPDTETDAHIQKRLIETELKFGTIEESFKVNSASKADEENDEEFDEFEDVEVDESEYLENENFDDQDVDYENEPIGKAADGRRRRKPPPWKPGRVILDVNDWTIESKYCLIEYRLPGVQPDSYLKDGESNTRMGIVLRPDGQRHWKIKDVHSQQELRINRYNILFQWPPKETGGLSETTIEEAKSLKAEAEQLLKQISDQKSPYDVWSKYEEKHSPPPSDGISVPHPDRQMGGLFVRFDEEGNVLPAGHPGLNPKPPKGEDKYNYLDLEEVARYLFNLETIKDTTQQHNDSNKIDTISTPPSPTNESLDDSIIKVSRVQLYATHQYLYSHPSWFSSNVHRGFYCAPSSSVYFKLKAARLEKREAQVRAEFVSKLQLILEKAKQIKEKNKLPRSFGDSSVTSQESHPFFDERVFTSEEKHFLHRLKLYALSPEDSSIDSDMSANILAPLGFGDKPHHAFDLLTQLGLISKHDNPHLLRYDGKLGFEKNLEKLAHEIVELSDGKHHPLRDKDSHLRVDFSHVPTFAIDDENPREVDDAISLVVDQQNREWIYVHIVDVERYIPHGSKLDLSAKSRGSTIYLPDTFYPIFPHMIVEHLSLGGYNMTTSSSLLPRDFNPSLEAGQHEWASLEAHRKSLEAKGAFSNEKSALNGHVSSSSNPRSFDELMKIKKSHQENQLLNHTVQRINEARGKQAVLSFGALLDATGKLEEWRIVPGYVSNVKRLTYDQLNSILMPKPDSKQGVLASNLLSNRPTLEMISQAHNGFYQIQSQKSNQSDSFSDLQSGERRESPIVNQTLKEFGISSQHLQKNGSSGNESSSSINANQLTNAQNSKQLMTMADFANQKSSSSASKLVAIAPLSKELSELKTQYFNIFVKFFEYAMKRRSSRLDQRAIIAAMPSPNIRVNVDSSGHATANVGVTDDFYKNSRGMITEFMLMASEIAGNFCRENSIPVMYTLQETVKADTRSLLDLAEQANVLSWNNKLKSSEITENLKLLRTLRPKVTTPIPSKHHAFGLTSFVSVTSPLRRYVDLLAHYQIKAVLRGKNPVLKPVDYQQTYEAANLKSQQSKSLSFNSDRFWILGCINELTKTDRYKKFKAVVLDAKSERHDQEATVMLLDFALQNPIANKRQLFRGETIWVRVDIVNPFYDVLILKEVIVSQSSVPV